MSLASRLPLAAIVLIALAATACDDDEVDLDGRTYDLVTIDGDSLPGIVTVDEGPVTILSHRVAFSFGMFFFMGAVVSGNDTLPGIGSGEYEVDGSRLTLDYGAEFEPRYEHGTIDGDVITLEQFDSEMRYVRGEDSEFPGSPEAP